MISPKYAKEMPGAETVFRPADQVEYAGHAWDIRISMGNAPLDEAFIFSMESYADAARSLRELIEQYALNPEREVELDVESYPELPFLQQEFIQCWSAAQRGALDLTVFVNLCEGAVDLDLPAVDFLSACKFRDRSWDYLVLDLIFEVNTPKPGAEELRRFMERYAELSLSDALREETRKLAAQYEKYASVSVAPCALGVPDGFDVRLQMMEFEGLDPERFLMLHYMMEEDQLAEAVFEPVCEALAFKTAFTAELLTELQRCGKAFEDA